MGKEKKSTIKFQKNKLKGVVKRRKEVNKLKRQIIKRELRRGRKDQPKGNKKRKNHLSRQGCLYLQIQNKIDSEQGESKEEEKGQEK